MKGAVFDMDGLMFDTERLWQEEWKKEAEKMGIVLDPVFCKEITGTSGDLMLNIIAKYYNSEDPQRIADAVRCAVEDDLKRELPEKLGLHEILDHLQKKGYHIAVASSSPLDLIRDNLQRVGISGYFEAVCCGQDVKHGKPAPDLFLLAVERLGLKPEECYVFEDAYNGIRAAYAANCHPIMVPDTQAPTAEMEEKADHICRSLIEAIQYIA